MTESVDQSGAPIEWRRWKAIVVILFFVTLCIATLLLVAFGGTLPG